MLGIRLAILGAGNYSNPQIVIVQSVRGSGACYRGAKRILKREIWII